MFVQRGTLGLMNNVTEREGGGDGCPPFLGSDCTKNLYKDGVV